MFDPVGRVCVIALAGLSLLVPWAAAREVVYQQDFEGAAPSVAFAQAEQVIATGEARRGKGCLRASFAEKKGGIPVIFSFDMDPRAVYKLSLWARSDNGCGMGVGVMNTWADRRDITRFYPIPKTWTRYETTLVPMKNGCKALWLYLPHTFLANPGTVWVDDIRVTEIGRFAGEDISPRNGYAEDVVLTATGPRTALVAWLDHTPEIHALEGKDAERAAKGVMGLHVAPCQERLLSREYRDGVWTEPESLAAGWLLHPAVSSDGQGRTCVVWSQRSVDDDRWTLMARVRRDGIWDDVQAIPGTGRNPCFPALAPMPGGGFLVASCVMFEGTWSIQAGTLTDMGTAAGSAVPLSEAGRSGYRPTVAVTVSGRRWVAWQEFSGTDYRIAGRYADPGGAWSNTLVLADGPDDEGHPVLIADPDAPDTVWLAYDVGVIPKGGQPRWGRSTGQRAKLRVEIRRIAGTRVRALPVPYESSECDRGERPVIVAPPGGGLWLFERAMGSKAGHWNLRVRHTGASGVWTESFFLSGGGPGTWLPAAAASLQGGILAVWQTDQRRAERVTERDDEATSWLVAQYLPGAEGARNAKGDDVRAKVAGDAHGSVAAPPDTIEFAGRTRRVFWGDLHIHSRLSLCARDRDLDPFDVYVYTRDYENIDFMALTDHGAHTNHADWFNTMKLASLLNAPGHFTAFLAQEWSSARAYRPDGVGHRNIIYPGAEVSLWFHPHFGMMPAELYKNLSRQGMPAIIIPHQIADGAGGAWTDWSHSDPAWEPLVEVFQIRGSYEYPGAPWMSPQALKQPGSFYQDVLSRGRQVGVLASSDHGGGHGKVAVFAGGPGRQSIFDALKNRRTFGTSNARMFLDFRINGELMGGVTREREGAREIVLRVRAAQPLREVVVFKNRRKILERSEMVSGTFETAFTDHEAEKPIDWYYLRAIQEDGHIAWSSPVWVARSKGEDEGE